MTPNDDFRSELLRRVSTYTSAENRAKHRLEELTKELETLRSRREAAEKLYTAEYGELPPVPVVAFPPEGRATKTQSKRPRRQELLQADGPLSGLSWQDAIAKVLAQESPLHVKEIWSRLDAGGFTTESKDPLRSIVAMSLRSPNVVRSSPNTYGLVKHGEQMAVLDDSGGSADPDQRPTGR